MVYLEREVARKDGNWEGALIVCKRNVKIEWKRNEVGENI